MQQSKTTMRLLPRLLILHIQLATILWLPALSAAFCSAPSSSSLCFDSTSKFKFDLASTAQDEDQDKIANAWEKVGQDMDTNSKRMLSALEDFRDSLRSLEEKTAAETKATNDTATEEHLKQTQPDSPMTLHTNNNNSLSSTTLPQSTQSARPTIHEIISQQPEKKACFIS